MFENTRKVNEFYELEKEIKAMFSVDDAREFWGYYVDDIKALFDAEGGIMLANLVDEPATYDYLINNSNDYSIITFLGTDSDACIAISGIKGRAF